VTDFRQCRCQGTHANSWGQLFSTSRAISHKAQDARFGLLNSLLNQFELVTIRAVQADAGCYWQVLVKLGPGDGLFWAHIETIAGHLLRLQRRCLRCFSVSKIPLATLAAHLSVYSPLRVVGRRLRPGINGQHISSKPILKYTHV
jgi:hypothetical protein